jgi:uncharacterized protein (TIGR02145 family)
MNEERISVAVWGTFGMERKVDLVIRVQAKRINYETSAIIGETILYFVNSRNIGNGNRRMNKVHKITLAVGFLLTLAFIFSCSSDDNIPCSTCSGSYYERGTIYGASVNYEGETYETVVIGTQTWFKRNLNYDPGTGYSTCYDNEESNCSTYGRLYDWETAMAVCPSGWHLPSNKDWDDLMRYVDGNRGTSSPYGGYTAGKYLKATSGWNYGGNGKDIFGFSALPGGEGYSGYYFYFNYVGILGLWWSSSESYSGSAYYRRMDYDYEFALWDDDDKGYLYSVRCVGD